MKASREEKNRTTSGTVTRASLKEQPAETLSYIPLYLFYENTEEEKEGMKDEG